MDKDLYETLGVEETADEEEIRRAFRDLAKAHHPDHAGDSSSDRFREIRDAYDVLSDRARREAYDGQRSKATVDVHIVRRDAAPPDDFGEPVHIGRRPQHGRSRQGDPLLALFLELLRW